MRPVRRIRSRYGLPALPIGVTSLLVGPLLAGCGAGEEAGDPGEIDVPSLGGLSEAASAASPAIPLTPRFDLAIENARIVDGTGAPARPGGVLVKDGVLVYVGPLAADSVQAIERVDAAGRVLAPGFIDAHAHGDPLGAGRFPNFLAQGVTTILLGQDGTSPRAGELPGLLSLIEARPPFVNVGYLVGHSTLRAEAGFGGAPSDAAGRARLAALVERGMEAGAFGLSLGLEYDGGRPADAAELAAAAVPVAARDGIVMSHMRNEDADQVERSLEELLEQGRRSGARVHVSHLKVVLGSDPAQVGRILARMEGARGEEIRVSADLYPYTASYTGISILFPDWARAGSSYPAVAATRRDELAAYLRARVAARNGPEATLFGTGPWAGRTLAEAAAEAGRPFEELLIDLGPGGARAAYFVMDDATMRAFLLDPHTVIASDGSPEMEHPRGYGAFARVIRRFVVEEGALSLEEAVAKMSGRTAALLGLDDTERHPVPRGLLRPGFAADLVLFHPERIQDTADFEAPHRLARGMDRVWVNGVLAWDGEGVVGGSGAGWVLRRSPM